MTCWLLFYKRIYMKQTFYFSHDYNARDDEKIMNMLSDLGMEWYWLYWALIELLAQNNWKISLDSVKGLWYKLICDNELITKLLHSYNLFIIDKEENIFYSKRLLEHLNKRDEEKEKKSKAWKKGMAKRWGKDNTVITQNNTVITNDNKGKESKINNTIINDSISEKDFFELFINKNKEKILEFVNSIYEQNYFQIEDKKILLKEILKFADYWLEKWKTAKKYRWEKEKTFELFKRLRTWFNNYKEWLGKEEKELILNPNEVF